MGVYGMWRLFLDETFVKRGSKFKYRDRVPAVCTECGYVSVVEVGNLIRQVRKLKTHLCWGCSVKRGTKNRDNKKYSKNKDN